VLFAGANWAHSNAAFIGRQKEQIDISLISLCHDVIPLLFPQFFKANDVAMLQRHFERVFAIASLNLVASKVVGADIESWCSERGIAVGPVKQVPFGYDLPAGRSRSTDSRGPRTPSRYILFVSTIEPRKGHDLAQAVWTRLLQQGIPQKLDMTLMLIGRPGWMVNDLMTVLRACERVAIMDNVDDDALAALYDQADFCIYPSEYEGYGLPVVEALARGKAVLASDVGVVPELQSSLLKRLPPRDEQAWTLAIQEWLLCPDLISRNADPATGFRHPTWQEAAASTFAAIEAFTGRKERTR
jgi:glycosyltransferase involved in cell wall biosynthesis